MMKCFECDKTTQIKKLRALNYTGVNLNNIVLLNIQVEWCADCQIETPLLQNVKKLHNAIGVAIALQKVHLSNEDLRYLRRSAGFSVGDWAKQIGVVEAHYSRLESGDRSITAQVDKLARIIFLSALKHKDIENVHLAKHLETVLNLNVERHNDFVIAIDAENLEQEAKYLPYDSPLLLKPVTSFVEANTMPFEPLTEARIVCGHSITMSAINQELSLCG